MFNKLPRFTQVLHGLQTFDELASISRAQTPEAPGQDGWDLCAEHDLICVHPQDKNQVKMSRFTMRYLLRLGWFRDKELQCWCHYV